MDVYYIIFKFYNNNYMTENPIINYNSNLFLQYNKYLLVVVVKVIVVVAGNKISIICEHTCIIFI